MILDFTVAMVLNRTTERRAPSRSGLTISTVYSTDSTNASRAAHSFSAPASRAAHPCDGRSSTHPGFIGLARLRPSGLLALSPTQCLVTLTALGLWLAGCATGPRADHREYSGNPILPGWYADPEVAVFGKRVWIYPTYSAPYDQQVFLDAFSSPDLVHWTRHPRILDTNAVRWARRAMWAPAVVQNRGRYFLFFAANDIQNDQEPGGIGVAVADRPDGPFRDYLGRPLIDKFHNGAQPIDQHVFRDRDGQWYMYYGGWRRCNVVRLKPDFTGLEPFPDGTLFREVTPQGYVEGPFMLERRGKYYFMWSEGGWTGPDYSVAYAIADSPLGPFRRIGKILEQDPQVATGAGHHSVLKLPGREEYYIVYHRRPLGERNPHHRVTCIDRMEFDEQGYIRPVRMTFEGVRRIRL